jgi:SET domain-containing protein
MNTNIQKVIDHLEMNVKSKIAPSPIHGIGVFAIKDIKKGEQVFPQWDGETGVYMLPKDKLKNLPEGVQDLLDMYFINEDCGYKLFRLFKGINFICHSVSYCNSAYPNEENINITTDGVATRDIKAGEEILEWYTANLDLENSK